MKKRIIFSVLLLFCINLSMWAQQPIEIKLWPDGAPNSNNLAADDERIAQNRITYIDEPILYVYVASNGNGKAVVACPGGGYTHLATGHEGHNMAQWFNSMGFTYAVLIYRMPNGNNMVPLSDAQQAIRIMRQHSDEWKIDKVGIMGSSAGGHLASTAATHFNAATRPDFQILFYPVISMDATITHGGSRANLLGATPTDEDVELYSNELQVNANTPPAFIMHSSDDRMVPVENSLRYYKALVENGVTATMHLYPIGGHGWGYNETFIYKRQWTGELEKWLREL